MDQALQLLNLLITQTDKLFKYAADSLADSAAALPVTTGIDIGRLLALVLPWFGWTLAAFLLGVFLKWLGRRIGKLRKWKRLRWAEVAAAMMPVDYAFRPDVYVARVGKAEGRLEQAFLETNEPLLIRGKPGVGKSAVLVWLLRERKLRAFVVDGDMLSTGLVPRVGKTVVVLDNIDKLKSDRLALELRRLVEQKRLRVIALVSDENYDQTWVILNRFRQVRIEPWSEEEGKDLAVKYGQEFKKDEFDNTALSVVASVAYMKRLYSDECSTDERAVLDALKMVGCMVGYLAPRKVVAAYAERHCHGGAGGCMTALRGVEGKWCLVRDDEVVLRELYAGAIDRQFSWDSGAWKELLGVLLGKPVKDWCRVAGRMAERMQLVGRRRQALVVCDKALEAGCKDPDMWGIRGATHYMLGNLTPARRDHDKALSGHRRRKHKRGIAIALHYLGMVYGRQGEYDKAWGMYEKSLKVEREIENKHGIAQTLGQMANMHLRNRRYGEARDMYQQILELFEELGDKQGIATTLHQLGHIHFAQDECGEALGLYKQSLELEQELRNKGGIAISLFQLGRVYQAQGEYAKAVELVQWSLAYHRELGDKNGIGATIGVLGSLAEAEKDDRLAMRDYGIAFSVFHELKSPNKDIVGRLMARMRERLGEEEFERLREEVQPEVDRELADIFKDN